MSKYVLELSPNDFFELAKKFEKLKVNIPKLKNRLLNVLADYTKERVQYYIDSSVNTEFSTGHLKDNIFKSKIFQDTIKVFVNRKAVPYAVYVEYGTGIVGAKNPHPNYSGNYKDEGWWYPTNENDPNPHKKQLENGDWIVYTEGQPAHKYIYNAFQDLEQNYKQIVIKVLKEEGYI